MINQYSRRFLQVLGLLMLTFALASCDHLMTGSMLQPATPPTVEHLVPQVLAVYPHDVTAFTEGLIWDNGTFYESTGTYGPSISTLRQVDPQTGTVKRQVKLGDNYFGEGLALVDTHLIQITWTTQIAYVYDRDTFNSLSTITYSGQGWGLCYDGKNLYMSDGSDTISVRDPQTFAVLSQIKVTLEGNPVTQLNELECVDDSLYENVWHTDNIMRIDKATGRITGVIDASGLLTPDEKTHLDPEAVLNGIAYDPAAKVFYVTGKLWPHLFKVNFVTKP